MKKTSAELKTYAKQSLVGNYGVGAGSILLCYVILIGIIIVFELMLTIGMLIFMDNMDTFSLGTLAALMIFLAGIFLLEYMMVPGFMRLYMKICHHVKGEISDIFYGFQQNTGKFFLLSLLMTGILIAMTLLNYVLNYALLSFAGFLFMRIFQLIYMIALYVVCFLALLHYGLVYFVMIDYPEQSIGSCLNLSRQMMRGNKGRLFYIMISFIGWYLIGCCTFGLAFLWLIPYVGCTFTHFYLDLKQDFMFPAV